MILFVSVDPEKGLQVLIQNISSHEKSASWCQLEVVSCCRGMSNRSYTNVIRINDSASPYSFIILFSIDDPDATFLPCEFCQELFPSENLIQHQVNC